MAETRVKKNAVGSIGSTETAEFLRDFHFRHERPGRMRIHSPRGENVPAPCPTVARAGDGSPTGSGAALGCLVGLFFNSGHVLRVQDAVHGVGLEPDQVARDSVSPR